MSLSAETIEIEAIVRLVVDRMRAYAGDSSASQPHISASQSHISAAVWNSSSPRQSEPQVSGTVLRIPGKVISQREIDGRLSGIRILQIQSSALVTPAVRDELTRHGVTIERVADLADVSSPGSMHGPTHGLRPTFTRQLRIIVASRKAQLLQSMVKEWTVLPEPEPEPGQRTAIALAQDLAANWESSQRVLWCSVQPYAAAMAVAEQGSPSIRCIGLHDCVDLESAIWQARPNLLIVDDKRWPTHLVARAAKSWARLEEAV